MAKHDPYAAVVRAADRAAKEAVRLARLSPRAPSEADRPYGERARPRPPLAGQLDIYGREEDNDAA